MTAIPGSPRAIGLRVCALSGLWSISLLGDSLLGFAVVAAFLVVLSSWLCRWTASLPWSLFTLAGLALAGLWMVLGGEIRQTLGLGLMYLMLHRMLGRQGVADDRVVLLLSGLMLVSAASQTTEIGWSMGWLGWAVGLPLAMEPTSAGTGGWRGLGLRMGLATCALLGAVALFPLFPRVGGVANPDVATIGMADEIRLGELESLLSENDQVFTVEGAPLPAGPLYLRGLVLNEFDGRVWNRTEAGPGVGVDSPAGDFGLTALTFEGLTSGGVLFTAGEAKQVWLQGEEVSPDRNGVFRADGEQQSRWVVLASEPFGRGGVADRSPVGDLSPYLEMPEHLASDVERLALSWTGSGTSMRQRAQELEQRLASDYSYTWSPRDVGAEAPLEDFLFDGRPGHCEYFASGLAMLLRSVQVPTRVVLGFVVQVPEGSDSVVVRTHHAHAWVEAWFEEEGWVRLDATPMATGAQPQVQISWAEQLAEDWNARVVAFSGTDQRDALFQMGSFLQGSGMVAARPDSPPLLGMALVVAALLAVAWILDRMARRVGTRLAGERPARRLGPVDQSWTEVEQTAAELGMMPPRGLPALSAARWLAAHGPFPQDETEALAWLVYRVRYAGESEGVHASQAQELARRIVQQVTAQATS